MKNLLLLSKMEIKKKLAETLSNCQDVVKYDSADEKESWTLVHSFSDLEISFRKIFDTLLPAILQVKKSGSDVNEILLEIGEEFRHIRYHLSDPKFYKYLLEKE